MKEVASAVDQRAFLLAACAWQESLLQSYRSLHVTIQGFLVTASSAVLAVQLTGAIQEQSSRLGPVVAFNLGFTVLLTFLCWLQLRTAKEFKGVVTSRSEDINHWHKLTLLSENTLAPDQRAFTYFKMWQHAHRADVTHILPKFLPEDGISSTGVDELIGRGLGHTRRVIDVNLFDRLRWLCVGIALVSVAVSFWFLYLWWYAAPSR